MATVGCPETHFADRKIEAPSSLIQDVLDRAARLAALRSR